MIISSNILVEFIWLKVERQMVVFFGLDLSSEVVLSYHELVGWLKGYK
jgi:hypothetical protein